LFVIFCFLNAFAKCFVRVFFADRQRATVSIVERSGRVTLRKQASYTVKTRDGLCIVTCQNAIVELTLLSLGGMLIELGCVVHKSNLPRGKLDLTCRAVNKRSLFCFWIV
jgi:hypothetical protein